MFSNCKNRSANELELSRFTEFLLKKNIAGEKHARFYVRWIRLFLDEVPAYPLLSRQDRLALFLKSLRKTSGEEWQVSQAERAINLFFHKFQNASPDEPLALPKPLPKNPDEKVPRQESLGPYVNSLVEKYPAAGSECFLLPTNRKGDFTTSPRSSLRCERRLVVNALVETTLLYNRVVKKLRAAPQSPLDLL